MSDYFTKGGSFFELRKDPDFQRDLVRFFGGGRYNMSLEEMEERGVDGLTEDFIEHMRFQDTNEATAAKDLFYARDREANSVEELASFGRLMSAWDNASEGGTGTLNAAGDYLQSILTSPSTWATVATAGLGGPASKIAAAASRKGTSIAVRKMLQDLVAQGAASSALKESLTTAALKGAGRGALVEGTLGAYQAGAQEQTREEVIEGYELDPARVALTAGLSAGMGGVLGGLARRMEVSRQNEVIDVLYRQAQEQLTASAESTKAAVGRISQANPKVVDQVLNRIESLSIMLTNQDKSRVNLRQLDPEQVDFGRQIRDDILSNNPDRNLTTSLSTDVLKGVTAATIDVIELVKPAQGERITSAVARMLREGTIDPSGLAQIRDKYGLTKEQMSYVYLSDLSEAGRTLGEAGQIARAAKREAFQPILSEMDELAQRRLSTLEEEQLATFAQKLQDPTTGGKIVAGLRELDAVRISMMTSQLATTAANVTFSTARLGIDAVDQVFRNAYTSASRLARGEQNVPLNPFRGVTSMIRGVTWGNTEAELARIMLIEDTPSIAKSLYYDITRVENATGSQTTLAKVGRTVNFLNNLTDGFFKQAAFYASIDRQLADLNSDTLGKSFSEFVNKHRSFEMLPEGMLERAVNDSLDFTFQKTYKGDPTLFARGARTVIDLHKRIPFVVSSQVPFPRYIANHMEFIHDYTPIAFATNAHDKYINALGAPFKDQETRWARATTGLAMLAGSYYFRSTQGAETSFLEYINDEEQVVSLERVSGPWSAHLLVADLLWRYNNDAPMPTNKDIVGQMLEVTAGLGELGYNEAAIENIMEAVTTGSFKPVQKLFADLMATFTYPSTVVRDLVGQGSPLANLTPYTRDITREYNFLDALNADGNEFMNRVTRFLPDVDFIQYSQSFDGKKDIPLYSPFNPYPVATLNPLIKQITGVDTKPPLTDLQKEMTRLNLKEWKIYTNSTVANPSVDVIVRRRLAKTLSREFEEWRSTPQNNLGGQSYDDLSRVEDRQRELEQFVRQRIQREEEFVEGAFNTMIRENPRVASGFIRNQYILRQKDFAARTNDKNIYDTAVSFYTDFETAEDYLASVETVTEEVGARQQIMQWAELMAKAAQR